MPSIDFRVWDGKNMVHFSLLELNDEVIKLLKRSKHLMQWTGLVDMTGAKVFTGDILKWGMQAGSHTTVAWNPRGFFASYGAQVGFDYLIKDVERFATVIGNIYQTPELTPEALAKKSLQR